MKYTFVLFLFLINYSSFAQNDEHRVEALVKEFSDELGNKKIDTFVYYKRYCLGKTVMFKNDDDSMCFSNGTYYEVYFFWKEEDQLMIKKMDNCGMFSSLDVGNDLVYNSFIENIEQLRIEAVKGYTVENPENVPAQRSDVFPCFREFTFNMYDEIIKKEYNLFDLTSESKYENIHYDYNQSLRIVDIDKIMEALILDLESDFKRQKN